MARPGPQTHAKRQREQAKMEKRRAKTEKMTQRKAQKKSDEEGDDSDTVDVAEIEPSPSS